MISWKKVRLIFTREVRDQLRDRRTLFMIAVLPMLLYPALGIGMVQLGISFSEQPRTVVLLGKKDLPPPQLLDGNHFASSWFQLPAHGEKLEVVTDDEPGAKDAPPDPRVQELLTQARAIRDELELQKPIQRAVETSLAVLNERTARLHNAAKLPPAERVTEQQVAAAQAQYKLQRGILEASRQKVGGLFAAGRAQVIILVPPGFGASLEKHNQQLASRSMDRNPAEQSASYPRPEIIYNRADDKSLTTYTRVNEVMEAWESHILKSQLELANLPTEFPHPVQPTSTNLALDEQMSANFWGKLFPALLVIMSVTGAFYPAIDLCAGEKERGTMETLLICPATRTEIVLGKFFTIMLFSCATALLNLMSMGMTGKHMVAMSPGGALARAGDVSLPSPMSMVWILVLIVPLAALFSALCLALATFARSSKEGQYYLSPLLMVTLGLTVFCLSPGVELTPLYSVMPVMGIALLLKGLLLAPLHPGWLYVYAIPVLVTSIGYSLLALWWAIEQFNREDVLFREAERFELALWIRHLLRDKEPTPSFTEAGFCFVMIMLLQFGAMNAFSQAALAGASEAEPLIPAAMRVLLIQQIAIIASPVLFFGIMLTTSLKRTFQWRLPSLKIVCAAAVLALTLHPLTVELAANLQWFFPQLPENVKDVMKNMLDPNQPVWLVLLCFAVAPAICEELAFRGFILSGFSRGGRRWLAIGLSSIAFGAMHMIPQQVFNASLVGIVLGMIAIRGQSLFPCILFHFIYNSLGVLHGRLGEQFKDTNNLFLAVRDGQLRYQWGTLVISAVIVFFALRWVAKFPRPADLETEGETFPAIDPHVKVLGLHETGAPLNKPV